jgi:hypothetical protein
MNLSRIWEKGEGYKLWDPKANKVVINRDVVFDENAMLKNTQKKEQQEPKNSSSDKQVVEVE